MVIFEETLRSTWIWWVGSTILLSPLMALDYYLAYGLSLLLLIGAWVDGIGAGYCVNWDRPGWQDHLGAIR